MNRVGIKSVGTLIDELSILNIKIWFKIETITNDALATTEELAKTAKDVQTLNARRSALIKAIDERLGDGDISTTDKTYE